MTLTFYTDSIINDVFCRLSYISGKRAEKSEEYFRFSPCGADRPLFRRLVGESASWLSISLGARCRTFSISTEAISFDIVSRDGSVASARNCLGELYIAMSGAIACRTIFLWLRLSGFSVYSEWEDAAEAEARLMAGFLSSGRHVPLKPRPIMP